MNILIVCNHFYPHNRIAAFRLNAFARYFREAGHSVTVITEGDRDETVMWNGCEVHYVKDPVITSSKQESLLQRRKKWAFRRILSALQFRLFLDYKRIWQFKASKKARKLAKSRRFDVVLSSYGHLSSHRIAYRLHRKTPFYWIADMRDEMSKWPWLLPINSRRLLFYERRILKDADLILSVSAPLVEDFKQIGGGIDKVIEITNGYDYEEVHDVSFQPVYTMAFIGHFYNSITPDKWFGAFSELVAEGALPSDSRILIIGNTSPLAVPENIRQNVFRRRHRRPAEGDARGFHRGRNGQRAGQADAPALLFHLEEQGGAAPRLGQDTAVQPEESGRPAAQISGRAGSPETALTPMPGRPGIGISAPNRNPALRSGSRKRETAAENGKPRSPYVRFGRNFASTGPNNSI